MAPMTSAGELADKPIMATMTDMAIIKLKWMAQPAPGMTRQASMTRMRSSGFIPQRFAVGRGRPTRRRGLASGLAGEGVTASSKAP